MRSKVTIGLLFAALALTACGAESADTTTTTEVPATTATTSATTVTSTIDETTTTVEETTTTTTEPEDPYTFEIVIEGTEVTGGGRISVPLGETVTLRITSDIDDEVHIHGYDIFVDLEAGVTAETSFVADIPGVVEIETHNSHLLIANLEAS